MILRRGEVADVLNLGLSLGIALRLKKEKFEHVVNGGNGGTYSIRVLLQERIIRRTDFFDISAFFTDIYESSPCFWVVRILGKLCVQQVVFTRWLLGFSLGWTV